MPLDIRASLPKAITTRHLVVSLEAYEGEEVVELDYDPAHYNAAIEDALTTHFETKPAQVCRDTIATFLTAWDLTAAGEPIPLTIEGIKIVPLFEVQVPIVNALMEDMAEMGKERQSASQPGSSTAKPQQRKSKAKGHLRPLPAN